MFDQYQNFFEFVQSEDQPNAIHCKIRTFHDQILFQ